MNTDFQHDSHSSPLNESFIPVGLPGGFFIYNAEGDEELYYADQNVINLFGCATMDELREHTHNSFKGMVHPDDLDRVENDIQAQTFTSEKQHDYVRYRITTKQGETHYVEDFGHLLHGEGGKKYFYVFIVDVDRDDFLNRANNSIAEAEVLSSMQNSDRLTGLLNRESFYAEVQGIMDGNRDENLKFIHFDIANFKLFNERHGFKRGDDLLCRIARLLRKEFPDAKIARLSNDHFAVCTCEKNVGPQIENMHASMLEIIEGVHVEIKAGIYELETSCTEVGTACDHARLACNTVKRRYDRIYGLYDVKVYELLRLQQYVVDSIDEAIAKQYLKVFYQPIVRTQTEKICGYEALVRWIDPEMGFLPPRKFINTLEEYRLIHKVDSFVIRKVCEDLNRLIEADEPVVPVSINLSRLDFELCDIFAITERYRARYDIPAHLIDIEITESALNDDASHLQMQIKKFSETGYSIWIDDFGSGYSSLNNLLDYHFDVLKLDMEFMRTYDEHEQAASLISNIVIGAQMLGVQTLQEGVESEQHFEFLRSIGCDRTQGYYFAMPMTLEESRKTTREKGIEWETVEP